MSRAADDIGKIVVERELPHSAGKVWRALTEPMLIEDWLGKNDFKPMVEHHFELDFDWGAVSCKVLEVIPDEKLAYSWNSGALRTVVTWTLTPTSGGTILQMQQEGFRAEQPRYYVGAQAGWPRFIDALELVVAQIDRAGN